MAKCLISCGANLDGPYGSPVDTLNAVFEEFPRHGLLITKKSRLYSSLAFPDRREPRYINGCLEIMVDCTALVLLDRLKGLETKMGRTNNSRWGSRVCDLDLLSFENSISPNEDSFNRWYNMPLEKQIITKPDELLLPHPRLQDRAFVLKPLMDFAEDWRHPVLNYSVKEMLDLLSKDDRNSVVPI